jgi:hypothetical protein
MFMSVEIKRINDVLYVPGIKQNLLLVGCISDQGYTVEFVKNICIIRDMKTRCIVGKGHRLGRKGFYKLEAKSIANAKICTMEQSQSVQEALLWHRRLGHVNFQSLHEMSKARLVFGLPRALSCNICQIGKQAKRKFPKSAMTTTKPFQLVHNDMCGPFETPAHNGAHYFVTFVDDYNKRILVVFMKIKSRVLEEFKRFKGIIENLK